MAAIQGTLFEIGGQRRRCPTCRKTKHLSAFYKLKKGGGRSGLCKACLRKRSSAHYVTNREQIGQQSRGARWQLRLEAIAAYGGKCVCCEIDDPILLSIDHKHGGGKQHQERTGGSRGVLIDLKRRGWPDDCQLLCWNCNCAKGFFGKCPHQHPDMVFATPKPIRHKPKDKRCARCLERKIAAEFHKTSPYCKPCSNTVQREYRALVNRGEWLPDVPGGLHVLKYCPRCALWKVAAEEFNKNASAYDNRQALCRPCSRIARHAIRKKLRVINAAWERRLRLKVLMALGGKCAKCGEDNPFFLSIDHIHRDGAIHRATPGPSLTKRVWKLGCPKDRFRVLCYNCNCPPRLLPDS